MDGEFVRAKLFVIGPDGKRRELPEPIGTVRFTTKKDPPSVEIVETFPDTITLSFKLNLPVVVDGEAKGVE
jgi:hypothetical protein